MDYEELQFAATVREVAKQLKHAASVEHFHDWEQQDRDELKIKREAWSKANPAIKFVPDAIRVLRDYAREIKICE